MKFTILLLLITVQFLSAQDVPVKSQDSIIILTEYSMAGSSSSNRTTQEMIQSDVFIYVTAGSMTGYLNPFEKFFRIYLMEEYGIGYKFYGCSVMGNELAFMNTMNARIKDAYGENFISIERSKAKVIFEKQS